MISACGLVVVRKIPSMLYMFGVLSGALMWTFFVKMRGMVAVRECRRDILGGEAGGRHVTFPAVTKGN
jgi:hypothetical protein